MGIAVYLDNNVWDFLFARKLDLVTELPSPDFRIAITREAEFEIPNNSDKTALRDFIKATIIRRNIKTDSFFGFYNNHFPLDEQRMGGIGVGRFASQKEISFISEQRKLYKSTSKRPTKLYQNEADIALAARSFHAIVLTRDTKSGPLRNAKEQGGKVAFLNDFENGGMTLRSFIENVNKVS